MKKQLLATLVTGALAASVQSVSANNQMSPMIVVGTTPSYSENNLAGSVDSITRDELAISHVDDTMDE
ncbi:hypothetical protein [Methylophaga thiooxydans]|uniref:hypothetical protein n=1 Tax=Methylophaga thiooxydans TaxID=392484 RepID=UPI0002DD147C|nr:hypothetical protein [Methylophaga thiooxydans]